jgi:ferredoxin-NADP reductase
MTFIFSRGEYPDYEPGQFAFFPLDGVNNDPKGPIRHFSLASSPTENNIIISTRIRDSPYKQRLASLEIGSKVKVSEPKGNFTLHKDITKPAILLSGGIGVTPFRSMIKYSTDKSMALRIVMFDSNRDIKNILYKKEFDSWASRNTNLKIVYTVTNESEANLAAWNGETGRIDKKMIEKYLDNSDLLNSIFYICGPPSMLNAMKELLQKTLQIQKDRITSEEFTGY